MAIISPLPYNIVNGQAVDSTPVMADFNQIVNNVNANAAALAGSSTQVFNAAPATTSSEVVTLGQITANPPQGAVATTASATTLSATTPSYTAATPGRLILDAFCASSTSNVSSVALSASGGTIVNLLGLGFYYVGIASGYIEMAANQTTAVTITVNASSASPLMASLRMFFLPNNG